jgi:predicted Zn-dependent protease
MFQFSPRAGLLPVVLLAFLSGCASTQVPLSDLDFAKYMETSEKKVDTLVGENKRDEAAGLLKQLAQTNPTRKAPWAKLAKMHFEAGNYGEAIVAADEVLQRDPADRVAKSVRAVSGLRVATRSLADLRNDEDMKGSARADAVNLAKVLRETLGEDVLVPPVDEEAEAAERQKAQARRYRKRKTAAADTPAPTAPAPKPAAPKVNGDPFSVLR